VCLIGAESSVNWTILHHHQHPSFPTDIWESSVYLI